MTDHKQKVVLFDRKDGKGDHEKYGTLYTNFNSLSLLRIKLRYGIASKRMHSV